MASRTAFIIPNYMVKPHHLWLLSECLHAIKRHEPGQLEHTWIIDDASTLPGAREKLVHLSHEFGCNIFFKSHNSGYAKTVNVGLTQVCQKQHDIAVTINSDCELLTPLVEMMQATFNMHPSIAVVGGLLLYESGRIQSAGQHVPETGQVREFHKMQYIHDALDAERPRFVHSVTGALQMIRLTHVTHLSEKFPMAYEDVELCMRAYEKGHSVFYQPKIKALHREGAVRGKLPSAGELKSIEVFDQYRSVYHLDLHHKRIETLNHHLQQALTTQKQSES